MLRPGFATLPSAYLLNHGTRRTAKTLSIPSLTICRVFISPKHKISHAAYKILDDRSHILYLATRERYKAIVDGRYDECQEGLWLQFISNQMQNKRVVRSWIRRRIDHAVTGALRMRGFDRSGRRLVDPDAKTLKGSELNGSPVSLRLEHAPDVLVGTVEVKIMPNIIETSFTEVQSQAGVIVDGILEICGRYHRFGRSTAELRNHIVRRDRY